ncbi:MAG: response regulator [Piscinibacter sp.]|uniref:response regulator n=1 Tax=Piscinibacter TaxID=1114981 RepID=UPI000FDE6BE5|nr:MULTISPECIES: helix-turn-helix domain-containing protein [Piscinibacter]MCW5667204.1 response regulator [Piscinibacter sp.]
MKPDRPAIDTASGDFSTLEVARMLGMAVRSVQLMVDRGELSAWKTPGGHRRISAESVQQWLDRRHAAAPAEPAPRPSAAAPATVLLIEDSKHYQNLIGLLLRQQFPELAFEVADDGISGLAMAGQLRPRVLIVDILLPGIDGATLITSLRSHRQFDGIQLIVVTSLDEADRGPYRFALEGVPVVHKSQLVTELPRRLRECLAAAEQAG